MLHSINAEQRLYVIAAGKGYSCLGFEYADQRARQVAAWLKDEKLAPTAPLGTAEHYAQYQAVMTVGAAHNSKTHQRCDADLVPELIGKEGRRVEVVDRYDERREFIVGKSTGWMPCHIELKNRRSISGWSVMGAPFKSLRVLD